MIPKCFNAYAETVEEPYTEEKGSISEESDTPKISLPKEEGDREIYNIVAGETVTVNIDEADKTIFYRFSPDTDKYLSDLTDHQTHAGVKRGSAALRAAMIERLGQGYDEAI